MPAAPGEVCVCAALRRASRAVTRAYDEALAPCGLTVMQFSALRHLERLGEPTLNQLAASMDVERSAVWRKLQPLLRDGLVAAGAGGGRAQRLSLTQDGRAAVERATPAWRSAQDRIHATLADDEPALLALLSKVQTHAEA